MPTELELKERLESAADQVILYNRCLRCGRKIKAPQQYGRVCARKVKVDVDKEKKAEASGCEMQTLRLDKGLPLRVCETAAAAADR